METNTGIRVPIPLAVATLAFHLLPGFSNLLYIRNDSAVIAGTCVTFLEMAWLAMVALCLLLTPLLEKGWTHRGISLKVMGWVWCAASFLGPVLHKYRSGELEMKESVAEDIATFASSMGAAAAWPALWILGLGALLPVTAPLYEAPPEEKRSYISLRKAHTEAGMLILWWSLAHGILVTVAYAVRAPSLHVFVLKMVPLVIDGKLYYTEGMVNFVGWVALFFCGALWYTDEKLRHPRFEWFTILHRLSSVGFIVFSNLHDYNTLPFAWPGILALLAVRLRTCCFSGNENGNCAKQGLEVAVLCRGLIRLVVSDRTLSKKIQPGQHLLIRDKSLSRWQWHPITVSSVDRKEGKLTLHIKDLGDWTRSFVLKWGGMASTTLPETDIELKGPHGSDLIPILDPTKGVIFIAGGVGITGISEAVQDCARKGVPFSLVWIVKSEREARALGDDSLWNRHLAEKARNNPLFQVRGIPLFQVYVTRRQGEENDAGEEELATPRSGLLRDPPKRRNKTQLSFSVFAVTFATTVATMAAFVVSRQLCCARSVVVDDSYARMCGTSHQCALAQIDRRCQGCDLPDEIREHASSDIPCCTVERCHLCFRGLPVLLVLTLAPLLAWLFLRQWGFLLWCGNPRAHYQPLDDFQQQDEHEESAQVPQTNATLDFDPSFLYTDRNIVSVQYGIRPNIGSLLE